MKNVTVIIEKPIPESKQKSDVAKSRKSQPQRPRKNDLYPILYSFSIPSEMQSIK